MVEQTKRTPVPPTRLSDQDYTRAVAGHLKEFEGLVPRIYTDGKGIPTMGAGVALAVSSDGGKPIAPQPIRPIPERPSPHVTPQGGDLWQATARIGQQLADAAGADGYANAVTGLQRGLNMLNQGVNS